MSTISYCNNVSILRLMCDYYVEILSICNFHPSRARNYAMTVISKLNNFAEVLAVRVHVDVYMATAALRSLTHETLCDTGQRTADTLKFTNHHLPITIYQIPPLLTIYTCLFCGEAAKNHNDINGKKCRLGECGRKKRGGRKCGLGRCGRKKRGGRKCGLG